MMSRKTIMVISSSYNSYDGSNHGDLRYKLI